jgi:hypothetical protein
MGKKLWVDFSHCGFAKELPQCIHSLWLTSVNPKLKNPARSGVFMLFVGMF